MTTPPAPSPSEVAKAMMAAMRSQGMSTADVKKAVADFRATADALEALLKEEVAREQQLAGALRP